MKKPTNLKLTENRKNNDKRSIYPAYEVRRKRYQDLKELRQDLKRRKEDHLKKVSQAREQAAERKKQKEINDLKSGKYEVIKNPEKIKKWKAKARKLIQKIPAELFYSKK